MNEGSQPWQMHPHHIGFERVRQVRTQTLNTDSWYWCDSDIHDIVISYLPLLGMYQRLSSMVHRKGMAMSEKVCSSGLGMLIVTRE